MTSALEGSAGTIVPISLTVNGRTGVTLFAPPWEDEDGEEWQGFLGDGAKILIYASTRELEQFISTSDENDLSDHPDWDRMRTLAADDFTPAADDSYDLDEVYELAAGDPDPHTVSRLADIVDIVARIADCCDDGALRSLVEGTPAFADLVDEDMSYQGKEGRRAWTELGDTIADSWERGINRVDSWLSWQGDFESGDSEVASEELWDRVDAEPVEINYGSSTWLTMRGYRQVNKDEVAVLFLGTDGDVAVFDTVEDLAQFVREADDHSLTGVEGWSELREVEDADEFTPAEDAVYDLRKPSAEGAELVEELVDYCNLDADTSVLDGPTIDRQDWDDLLEDVVSCLKPQS